MRLFLFLVGLLSVFGQDDPDKLARNIWDNYVINYENAYYMVSFDNNAAYIVNGNEIYGNQYDREYNGSQPVDPIVNDQGLFNFDAWSIDPNLELLETETGIYEGVTDEGNFFYNNATGQQVFEDGSYAERRAANTVEVYKQDDDHYMVIKNNGTFPVYFNVLTGIPLDVAEMDQISIDDRPFTKIPHKNYITITCLDGSQLLADVDRNWIIYKGCMVNSNKELFREPIIEFVSETPQLVPQPIFQNSTITKVNVYKKQNKYFMISYDHKTTLHWDIIKQIKINDVASYQKEEEPPNYNSTYNEELYIESLPAILNKKVVGECNLYYNEEIAYYKGQLVDQDQNYYSPYMPETIFDHIKSFIPRVCDAIISAFNRIFRGSRSIPRRFRRNIEQLENGTNPVEAIEEINLLLTPRQTRRFRRNVNRNLRLLQINNNTALHTIINTINGAFVPLENAVLPTVVMAAMTAIYISEKRS
jgi:hypothetical protein